MSVVYKKIGDVEVITTTDLCKILGVQISSYLIEDDLLVKPRMKTKTAVYWSVSDIPAIATKIAHRLLETAIDYS